MAILRNSEEWRVSPEELARRCKDSVSSVKNQLNALEKAGYVRTYRKFLGRGKGSETYRFCADVKITNEVFEELKKDIV